MRKYRLYSNLNDYTTGKRVISDAALINDDKVTRFEFGSYRVIFEDGEIKLFGETGMIDHCRINDFIRKPNAQFRGLMRALRLGNQ